MNNLSKYQQATLQSIGIQIYRSNDSEPNTPVVEQVSSIDLSSLATKAVSANQNPVVKPQSAAASLSAIKAQLSGQDTSGQTTSNEPASAESVSVSQPNLVADNEQVPELKPEPTQVQTNIAITEISIEDIKLALADTELSIVGDGTNGKISISAAVETGLTDYSPESKKQLWQLICQHG